jgi:hypothetical protein
VIAAVKVQVLAAPLMMIKRAQVKSPPPPLCALQVERSMVPSQEQIPMLLTKHGQERLVTHPLTVIA